jgi:hypothetical protein
MTNHQLVSALSALAPRDFSSWHTHVARNVAAATFVLLLAALGIGLWRTRKQLERDEVDAALENDFRRLERELGGGRVELDHLEPPPLERKEG